MNVGEHGQRVRCIVSGRVQGVFYRASTADRARALGLDGYARNLDDGRVEVVAGGCPSAVSQLLGWLWEGPPAASVTAVAVEEYAGDIGGGFAVR
jgi:acylphosphatase